MRFQMILCLSFVVALTSQVWLQNTCFKSVQNPSCIDLILNNRPNSFQNSKLIETGLSDFHKLTTTVLKTSFRKMPPRLCNIATTKSFLMQSVVMKFITLLIGLTYLILQMMTL